jgi:hypothetical protein
MNCEIWCVMVDIVKQAVHNVTTGSGKFFPQLDGLWSMAENESLDLNSIRAGRWIAVLTAVRKGDSCEKVVMITRKCLLNAIRIVVSQFEEYEVTIADFLSSRGSPQVLRTLIRQTKGHHYAELMVSTFESNPGATNTQCLNQWLHAILDKVFDQVSLRVGGSETFPSFHDTGYFFEEVRSEVRDELSRMAIKLIDDPHWRPSFRGKKGEPKSDATVELLSMSLVGGAKS